MFASISLIVPTRHRPEQLRAFLATLAATAQRPDLVEVVLVIDADDPASLRVDDPRLMLKRVVVTPRLTMGALNQAGFEAASGDILMLLNDDVSARTPGWDVALRHAFAGFPDGIVLAHVNDTVMQKALCTFPAVSRRYCELAGGICPRGYLRYRIDDHIEDHFNLLGLLGERRSLYLPDVVFEHHHYVLNDHGVRQYFSAPRELASDARLFEQLLPRRKKLALELKTRLALLSAAPVGPARLADWRRRLETVTDSLAFRRPERLRVVRLDELTQPLPAREPWANELRQRFRHCYRQKGYRGLAHALLRRLIPATRHAAA